MLREALAEYLPMILDSVLRSAVIFVVSLGIVYMFGRMLEIVNSNRGRNLIAILVAYPLAYWSIIIYDMQELIHPMEIYWRTLVYGSMSCIFFVLIGWRLFDRADKFLDKKFAPDDGRKYRNKK